MKMLAEFSQRGLEAYADAGAVATEVISSIRTVVSFGAEDREVKRYSQNLAKARKLGVKKGMAAGNFFYFWSKKVNAEIHAQDWD